MRIVKTVINKWLENKNHLVFVYADNECVLKSKDENSVIAMLDDLDAEIIVCLSKNLERSEFTTKEASYVREDKFEEEFLFVPSPNHKEEIVNYASAGFVSETLKSIGAD
tara:strand:- start:513 stop:842 length:330 start_codon:yes stop_codon:yes gene_type:complete